MIDTTQNTSLDDQVVGQINVLKDAQNFMHYPEFHYRWEWRLQSSLERLWPLVTDTNRFNRDTGVPAVERSLSSGEVLSNARRRLKLFRLGIPVEWEEEPFEWVYPYRFGVIRRYLSGPVAEMRVRAEMRQDTDGSTHLVYEVWARAANPLGMLAIPVQIGFISARSFDAAFRRYDRIAALSGGLPAFQEMAQFVRGGQERLNDICTNLQESGTNPVIVQKLRETVERFDSLTLARLKPYSLADSWGLPRRSVLEHFLLATRLGLFELQWDLLCPLCRGAKETATTLNDIHPEVHCDTCNIDFNVNFERSVELTFRLNANIREVETSDFCIAGPQTTPHVVVQQLLQPGEERIVPTSLGVGRYRLRTLDLRGGEYIQVMPDGLPEIVLRASRLDGWPESEVQLSPTPKLVFKNATESEQLFILEQTAWSDQAVTAAEVTVLQVFRDLFAREALRPGQQISVGSLTIVFTDLRGSTRLYQDVGDAPAFGLVMDHFDILKGAITAEGGSIVKTIGDAVMAVFRHPSSAVRAMLNAQRLLVAVDDGTPALSVRAGIHYGSCIAVTLNDRLDYFGSTVNMAARLEGLSSGGDVVISGAVRGDPEMNELLASDCYRAEAFQANLKGFDDSAFELWRVSLAHDAEGC